MKKGKKVTLIVILSVLGIVFASLAILICMNFELAKGVFNLLKSSPGNNFKAAWIFLTNNSSDIETQIIDNEKKYDQAIEEILSNLNEYGTSISKEAIEALNSGNYTEEEMIRIIASGGDELDAINKEKQAASESKDDNNDKNKPVSNDNDTDIGSETIPDTSGKDNIESSKDKETDKNTEIVDSSDEKNQQTGNTVTTPDTSDTLQPAAQDDTAASIAKLYVVRSRFLSELASIETAITDAYESLPEELRTPSSRKSIAGEYISRVSDLELECDAEVETITEELRLKLEESGKDTSVVDTIKQAYEEEKSLKKAYYLDIYMNGLPRKSKAS